MNHLLALYSWHHSGRHPMRNRCEDRLSGDSAGFIETKTYDSAPNVETIALTQCATSDSSSADMIWSKSFKTAASDWVDSMPQSPSITSYSFKPSSVSLRRISL